MKKNRERRIRQQIDDYKDKLSKMSQSQLKAEWNHVILQLNPDSLLKERIEIEMSDGRSDSTEV